MSKLTRAQLCALVRGNLHRHVVAKHGGFAQSISCPVCRAHTDILAFRGEQR